MIFLIEYKNNNLLLKLKIYYIIIKSLGIYINNLAYCYISRQRLAYDVLTKERKTSTVLVTILLFIVKFMYLLLYVSEAWLALLCTGDVVLAVLLRAGSPSAELYPSPH